jgi:iron(III) transport system substrate-binding protein
VAALAGGRERGLVRRLLRVAALAGLAVLGACGGDSGRTPLVIYSPHGRDLLAHFEARFEAEHPDVDVQWVDMGSQEVLDRIRSEKANPQADVWWGAPAEIFERAASEGLLAPTEPSWAGDVPPAARDSAGLWFGTYRTPEVIAYNSDALQRGQAPQQWDDILEPKWRDKVLIRDPLASGTMHAIFGAIMWREYQSTGDPEAGYRWLLRLDAQTRDYVLNPTLLYQKLARQEGLVTVWDMPDIETLRATTRLPIDYLVPSAGTPVVVDGIAVVAGAKHPEMARAFVEWAGSRPELLEAARRFFRIPVRNDLPSDSLPAWLRKALPGIRPMEVDRAYVQAHISEWLRHWDRDIRGRGRDEGY